MPEVELSPSTYGRLFAYAESFEDTADEVVQRLLDRVEKTPIQKALSAHLGGNRASPGSILPEREYWRPILEILEESDGGAAASEVIELLGKTLQSRFTAQDLEELEMGEVRWRNRARFARLRMREQGLLSSSSPRGIWEMTEDGRRYLSMKRSSGER